LYIPLIDLHFHPTPEIPFQLYPSPPEDETCFYIEGFRDLEEEVDGEGSLAVQPPGGLRVHF